MVSTFPTQAQMCTLSFMSCRTGSLVSICWNWFGEPVSRAAIECKMLGDGLHWLMRDTAEASKRTVVSDIGCCSCSAVHHTSKHGNRRAVCSTVGLHNDNSPYTVARHRQTTRPTTFAHDPPRLADPSLSYCLARSLIVPNHSVRTTSI